MISSAFQRLLVHRNISADVYRDFISWNLNDLPGFSSLKDIKGAACFLSESLKSGKKIGIFGDYDVDGTTSCALFYHFFYKWLGVEVELIQPSRFVEGYGLHPQNIDDALSRKIDVLITVDCGITSHNAASYAKERGLHLIVTDHHKDKEKELVPAEFVINPNRRDETNEDLKALAGVGVAFALCLEIKKVHNVKESIYPLLAFVAIGTICDLAPLNLVNLKLVRHGLKLLATDYFVGLLPFFPPEERKEGMIEAERLSFLVGPMINSKGRLDHPEKALEMLISDNIDNSYECFHHLEICNKERKKIQSKVFEEACEIIDKKFMNDAFIVVFDESWHEGVIGIVASKIVENYKRPCLVLTSSKEKDVVKGSARSVEELDIFMVLNKCQNFFLKFGGHKMAAGLSMPKSNLNKLRFQLNDILESIPRNERTSQLSYDIDLELREVNFDLYKELARIGPFGQGNPLPVFKSVVLLKDCKILKDIHVKWVFSDNNYEMNGISFNFLVNRSIDLSKWIGKKVEIFYSLNCNRWKGRKFLQLMVRSISPN